MEAVALLGVADHPALELLNSTTDALGYPLDVLADGAGLITWLTATGLLSEAEAAAVRKAFSSADLDAAAGRARSFRETLRRATTAWSSGRAVPRSFVTGINTLLAMDRRHGELAHGPDGLQLAEAHVWTSADSLLALPAAAAADLFASGDPMLVRQCEGVGCTMWFYDRTKAHRRRWCSMAVCGNRAKARAHRARTAS